jgi:hypothetical protein
MIGFEVRHYDSVASPTPWSYSSWGEKHVTMLQLPVMHGQSLNGQAQALARVRTLLCLPTWWMLLCTAASLKLKGYKR